MYLPTAFKENNPDALAAFIEAHPFGLFITGEEGGPSATPMPFLFRKKEGAPYLFGHMAKANPHWRACEEAKTCLVVFQGEHNYVTPSWYASKRETHRVVPTWNYETLHVKGRPRAVCDADWLREHVRELTDAMERLRPSPWKLSDAPEDFVAPLLKAIVGIEICVTDMCGKRKLSQNRSPADVSGVVAGLSDPNDPHRNPALADVMRTL
ncbi:MAG: FMN-binding negative transcriptional regulator [Rickettsiales bacterium]